MAKGRPARGPSIASIAVVVPWGGNRPDLLAAQVRCLVLQDIDRPIEIRISVNNSGGLAEADGVAAMSTPTRSISVVDATERPGPAHARNRGASAGPVDILLFCDADDEADQGWVRHMADALDHGACIVGGRLEYERLNPIRFMISRAENLPIAFGHLPFTPSASLGVRSDVFAQAGGFDEGMSSGEDIDFCWRVQYSGGNIAFAEEAVLHYRLRQTAPDLFEQGVRYGRSDVQLAVNHRERGLKRPLSTSLGELARLIALAFRGLLGTGDRMKLALKLGTVVGHVQGSMHHRIFFL